MATPEHLKKILLTVVLLVLCMPFSHAQQEVVRQEEKPANLLQFTLSLQPGYNREDKVVNLQHFEAAVGWSRRPDRLFEIGLSNISTYTKKTHFYNGQPLIDPTVNTTRSLALNAAYYVYFRPENARLKPYVSAGWATYLAHAKNIPGIQTSFPSEGMRWSNSLVLRPGVRYSFSNLFFKLELPVTPVQLDASFQRVQNPAIPIRNQKQNKLEASYFPFRIVPLELGLGYRLAK